MGPHRQDTRRSSSRRLSSFTKSPGRPTRRWRAGRAATPGPVRLGQEGRRGRLRMGDDPFQMAADLRRLKRENERLKRAKSKFIFPSEGRRPVSEMCAALGATRRGHCARKGRPPSAHAMRDGELAGLITRGRSEVRGIYGAPKALFALRRMGVRQAPLGREARSQAGIGRRPGQAQVQRRRPQHGAVRRHNLREDPAGPAAPGAGDGHMIEADRRLGHGPGPRRRARRRGPEDGPGQAKRPERMRASLGSRSPVRVAAAVQDRARTRRAPVHGLDILAVGQCGHGVAHGHREVGVRARARRPRWTSSGTSRRCATGRGPTRRWAT